MYTSSTTDGSIPDFNEAIACSFSTILSAVPAAAPVNAPPRANAPPAMPAANFPESLTIPARVFFIAL